MDLLGGESVILGIGDLRLSDTYDTFGDYTFERKEKVIGGFSYAPIMDKNKFWYARIDWCLSHGDEGLGICIGNSADKIFLTYGANRLTSNAQSMAIGYHDDDGFFFVDECFGDIYSDAPAVSSRSIVRTHSLDKLDGSRKVVYNPYFDRKIRLSKADKIQFEGLLSKISAFEKAFSEENLNCLRRGKHPV